MEIIDLDSDQSGTDILIKQFAKTYTSPNITIENKGTTDLYILDIYCEQKDFIKDKASDKNIIIVSEAGNSVIDFDDLKQQYPKKVSVGSNIVIQLKITAVESVVLPTKLFIETNEDGGRKRVFTLKGQLPVEPRIQVEPVHLNAVRFPMAIIEEDKWNDIVKIDGDGIGDTNQVAIETTISSDILSATDVVTGTKYILYYKGTLADSAWITMGASSDPTEGEEFIAIADGPSSINNCQVQLAVSSDNYLTYNDYITVKNTNNYNCVHKVTMYSPSQSLI